MNEANKSAKAPSSNSSLFEKIENVTKIVEQSETISEEDAQTLLSLVKEIDSQIQEKDGKVRSYFSDNIHSKLSQIFPDNPLFAKENSKGNVTDSIELLVDGEMAFSRILEHIHNETKSIEIRIFLWRDDKTGNELAQALLDSANHKPEGVKITIIKDRLGAIFEYAEQGKQSFFNKDLTMMEKIKASTIDGTYQNADEANSSIQQKNPVVEKLLNHPNVKVESQDVRNDHSKYFIFGDETIVTGGMNIGDEYREEWHDYMVEIKNSPHLVDRIRSISNTQEKTGSGAQVDFVANKRGSNTLEKAEIKPTMLSVLSSAKEVIIEMAYIGDPDITAAIQAASKRGAKVSLIIPEHANIQDDLNKRVAKQLLSVPISGAEI